ncbi:unnamed protein product [Pleuronectes platessa]|uniref:Uncharacterized protein n=1 Tax=Pleuronectes platessa TaxID=8262 RepID=A0A9N7Y845_PLEPL|nr:unnamed protein product [Pleuronectes platessa]
MKSSNHQVKIQIQKLHGFQTGLETKASRGANRRQKSNRQTDRQTAPVRDWFEGQGRGYTWWYEGVLGSQAPPAAQRVQGKPVMTGGSEGLAMQNCVGGGVQPFGSNKMSKQQHITEKGLKRGRVVDLLSSPLGRELC